MQMVGMEMKFSLRRNLDWPEACLKRTVVSLSGAMAGGLFWILPLAVAETTPGELVHQEAAFYRAEGRALQAMGDMIGAAAAYRKGIYADSDHTDLYNDLGVVLEALGSLDEAEEAYQTALILDPKFAAAHTNLALLYERKGMLKEAASHWSARIGLGPADDPWVEKARQRLNQHNLRLPDAGAKPPLGKSTPSATPAPVKYALAAPSASSSGSASPSGSATPSGGTPSGAFPGADALRAAGSSGAEISQAAGTSATQARRSVVAQATGVGVVPAVDPELAAGDHLRPEGLEGISPELLEDAQAISEELARAKKELRSQRIKDLYDQGITAMRQGRYEEAASAFQQLLDLDPTHLEAQQHLKRAQTAVSRSLRK